MMYWSSNFTGENPFGSRYPANRAVLKISNSSPVYWDFVARGNI